MFERALKKELAECVGLWLAEGDKKSTRELTFTNNSLDLILFFQEKISKIYKYKNKPRLYVYSPSERQLFTNLEGFKVVKFYVDKRANRPYYIYRLADTNFLKQWKLIVNFIINSQDAFSDILRGIFAGEGNIKYDVKYRTRFLRIASKYPDGLIEKILKYYNIDFKFDYDKRQYWIRSKYLDDAGNIKIAELHPEKEAKFNKMLNSRSEKHYAKGEFKKILLSELNKFQKTTELSEKFNRSQLRVLEVLRELKTEGKADWIKDNGKTVWIIKDKKEDFLKKQKKKILSELKKQKNFTQIGNNLKVSRKYVSKRFQIYEKEKLIEKTNKGWILTEMGEKLICGIDESGRERN